MFLNICLPLIYKANKTISYNLLSFNVIIANSYKYIIISVKLLLNSKVF
jgi:hypothetical protein